MANEFVARKGLISSGSINVSGSVTASFFKGDGSQLTNIPFNSSVNIDTYKFEADGVTANYILSQSYYINSLEVYVGGIALTPVIDYTLSTNTLTFVTTPPSASNILVRAFVNATTDVTGSFTGSLFGTATSASYATTALFVLQPTFSGSFTGSFTGDGSPLTFTTLNTSQSSNSQLIIGNIHNNYQYRQTTVFRNGDIVVSGSATISPEGMLVLTPRTTPIPVVGGLFYSTSGDLYVGI